MTPPASLLNQHAGILAAPIGRSARVATLQSHGALVARGPSGRPARRPDGAGNVIQALADEESEIATHVPSASVASASRASAQATFASVVRAAT